jgi:hypothetical protein
MDLDMSGCSPRLTHRRIRQEPRSSVEPTIVGCVWENNPLKATTVNLFLLAAEAPAVPLKLPKKLKKCKLSWLGLGVSGYRRIGLPAGDHRLRVK